MNKKVKIPLSIKARKLPLDHIHYSSVEKLITTIDVLRFILNVSLLMNYCRVVIHTTKYVTRFLHTTDIIIDQAMIRYVKDK